MILDSTLLRNQQRRKAPSIVPDVKVTYDKTVNAAYIYFTDPQVNVRSAHTYPCDPIDVDGMINLDFDEQGRLIGIEVLAATSKLPEHMLQAAERLESEDN
ncbi:DUF2283 domain-containing protein [Streptomyces parvulus]